MKKYLYSMFALAAMFFASCSQDDIQGGDYVEASFTVNAPLAMGTRAVGDGTTANVVACAVYNKDGVELENLRNNSLPIVDKKATYKVRLVKGQSYRVAFFAYNNTAGAYDITDLKNIKFNDGQLSNIEARDAFTAYVDITKEESMDKINKDDIILYRPFAQLNFGSLEEDIEAARKSGIVIKNTKVTVSDVYTAFNAYEDAVTGETSEMVFELNTLPTQALEANDNTYKYLAFNYILVGDRFAEKRLTDVKFEWEAENGYKNDPVTIFNNVPVQRNYRTNIIGYLLTNPAEFNLIIEEEFTNSPDDDYIREFDENMNVTEKP